MTDPAKLAVWLESMLFEDEADQDKAGDAADTLRTLAAEVTALQAREAAAIRLLREVQERGDVSNAAVLRRIDAFFPALGGDHGK